jgi:hypothetical protein
MRIIHFLSAGALYQFNVTDTFKKALKHSALGSPWDKKLRLSVADYHR